jgi:hypothetical protein
MFRSNSKRGKIHSATLALFVFLFLFQITPYARAISHVVVHEQGIHHHHEGAPENHSQQDHTSGKVHDLLHDKAPLTLQNGLKPLTQTIVSLILPLWVAAYPVLSEPDPPPILYRGHMEIPRPAISEAYLISVPLRAPPSA